MLKSRTTLLSLFAALAAAALSAGSTPAFAGVQEPAGGHHGWFDAGDFIIPRSSLDRPEDRGVRAHTNFYISKHVTVDVASHTVPYGVTPQQLRTIYNVPPTLIGQGAIAIVDAYDYPTALADFNTYSTLAGVALESSKTVTATTNKKFEVVYASGKKPAVNTDWNLEEALDIEIAHAMAPGAKIYLVEAADSSFSSLFSAVQRAAKLPGVKEVSMSWGGDEFSGEASYDTPMFGAVGVYYFASSGDDGMGVSYPAGSRNVVAVGGTTLHFRPGTASFTSESAWSGSGGGPSLYEVRPAYQAPISPAVPKVRSVPDVAADADPNSGIGVYSAGFWWIVGGTSLACPMTAAMTNLANPTLATTGALLTKVYATKGTKCWRDIVTGSNGYPCKPGYDYVTGIGVPNGLAGF